MLRFGVLVFVFVCKILILVFIREDGVVGFIAERGSELVDAASLDLSDAFSCEVEERADFFKRDAAPVGDIQCACLGHFPDFEVREVHFDGTGLWHDVEVEVVFA